MAEMTTEEWIDHLLEKVMGIIDNSNDMYDIFEKQGRADELVVDIHKKTDKFANISNDELLSVADTLSNLVYATPMYDDFFYVLDKDSREMIFFTNDDERREYSEKNGNCKFFYLRYRDFFTLKDYLRLDMFTVFLSDGYMLNFSEGNIESFYNIVAYENMNFSSDYIVGQPSESYEKAIEIINPKLKENEDIKNVWLFHVLEMKNKKETVINDKYEEMYDVFVVESEEKHYISTRDYINRVVNETNGHKVKVVLHNSDLGEFLLKDSSNPVYSAN